MHKIAIIADPHFHEIFPGYSFEGTTFDGKPGACIRTRSDSAKSTRIFNESYFAFVAALDDCVAEGIKTVAIAGDLTDDGQIATMDAALGVLKRYAKDHSMRFFLTPGNHDVFGMSGRHHEKAFYTKGGGSETVTSDQVEAARNNWRYDPSMFCRSYAELAPLWAPYGIKRSTSDLYWECPFGQDDSFETRMFEMVSPDGSVTHRQLDLSYLVEPEPGLWLVAVDANVFEPRNGRPDNQKADAFEDSTDAGWNALVRLKPFILDWLADVSARAEALGKTLVCFSHYPVLDTYDDTVVDEAKLFGGTQATRRTPLNSTSEAVARTDIGMHFSGHLHVSDTNSICVDGHKLTNVAVPSPVAFPPAFAIVSAGDRTLSIEHRMVEFERFDAFFDYYRRDALASGHQTGWYEANSYPQYLYGHVRELVLNRYLPTEWPTDLAGVFATASLCDLFTLAGVDQPIYASEITVGSDPAGPSAVDLVVDWYAARIGSEIGVAMLDGANLVRYRQLIEAFRSRCWSDPHCLQSRVKLFLEMMVRYLGDDDCAVDTQ